MAEEKILFINEKEQSVFTLKDDEIKKVSVDIDNVKKAIISDALIELKLIIIPVVSKKLLKNIIINTIKKHSTIKPSNENVDFIILNEEEKNYEILVFIKHKIDTDLSTKKIFSFFHIINNLVQNEKFPKDVSFLTNSGKVWFLYSFKNKIFKRRDIYFHEDLKNLKNKHIYFFNLFSNTKLQLKNINEIPIQEQIKSSLFLKNGIFEEKKWFNDKRFIFLGIAIIIAFGITLTLEIKSLLLSVRKNNLAIEQQTQEKLYEQEKAKRGISDELYQEYIKLLAKKSNVNDFFYNLYKSSKNNIEINTLSYSGNKFIITGSCLDDSKLEDYFRKNNNWKKVDFSFTRKYDKIYFRISGDFINE